MTELRTLWRRHERALSTAERTRVEVHEGIAAALRAGVRPRDIVAETGLAGETVRRIAREQGVPPLREATVVSKRRAAEPDA